jgi:hypothetical protein
VIFIPSRISVRACTSGAAILFSPVMRIVTLSCRLDRILDQGRGPVMPAELA